MATIFIDGFDKYGIVGQNSPSYATLLGAEYVVSLPTGTNIGIAAGLSSTGYSFQYLGANSGWITKTFAANYSRLIGGTRFQCSFNNNVIAPIIVFGDSGSNQCSISMDITTGKFQLRNGALNGTVLATSSAFITANVTHYIEWDITFGASAAYQIWLNGVSIISGTGNTKTTANSSANQFILGNNIAQNWSSTIYDDFYLFDTTGSTNNAVLNTNPRIETQYPTSDAQTQWTNAGNVLIATGVTQTGVSNITTATNAPGANQLVLLKVTPPVNCTINSVGILPAATSAGAKFKAVIYADSAGSPNTLVSGSTTEVTGAVSGTALTLAFNSPQALTASTSYWIGYITDTSVALSQYDNTTNLGQRKANTYASGAPDPATGMTTAQPTWEIWGNCTGAATNWQSVKSNPVSGVGPSADNSSITSTTVGNEDLYGFPALTTTPASVYTVAVKGVAKLTGSGTRTITLNTKSDATTTAGSNAGTVPGNSYAWITSFFETDPDGSVAWTGAAVNAATAGPKVTV